MLIELTEANRGDVPAELVRLVEDFPKEGDPEPEFFLGVRSGKWFINDQQGESYVSDIYLPNRYRFARRATSSDLTPAEIPAEEMTDEELERAYDEAPEDPIDEAFIETSVALITSDDKNKLLMEMSETGYDALNKYTDMPAQHRECIKACLRDLRRRIREIPAEADGVSLKCPKCNDGHAGTDHTGEAIDCHYCGGSGRLMAETIIKAVDAARDAVGDAMACDALGRELEESDAEVRRLQGEVAGLKVERDKLLSIKRLFTHDCNKIIELADWSKEGNGNLDLQWAADQVGNALSNAHLIDIGAYRPGGFMPTGSEEVTALTSQ
ncbi:hypothetical protein [Planctomyces sp. SH-PL14]|uniref:hypothetical protein n=1 Tax=Planctomyces sp. SH-PL14 TaxID=1632864 RepID=UPI00078DEC79|nr:hypothetical protein [Planctomyces sp. SH-PL14]AMV20450.1 hypothetical protein VT03_21305 [Planctomyces sp. SH-PL14]